MNSSSKGYVIQEMCKKFETTKGSSLDVEGNHNLNVKSKIINAQGSKAATSLTGSTPNRHSYKNESISSPKLNTSKVISKDCLAIERENNITKPRSSSIADKLKLFEEPCQRSKRVPLASDSISPQIKNSNRHVYHATFAVTKTDEVKTRGPLIPPKKPPRTFAHDLYVESKNGRNPDKLYSAYPRKNYEPYNARKYSANPVKLNEKSPTQVFVDLTSFNLVPSKHYGTLKRSFSEEHIYDLPHELQYLPNRNSQPFTPKTNESSRIINPKELHYMSTPIVGINQSVDKSPRKNARDENSPLPSNVNRKVSATTNIREIVNQSFNELWKRLYVKSVDEGIDQTNSGDVGDSGSEVTIKEVQDRIIYVKSLRTKVISTPGNERRIESTKLFNRLLVSCVTPARKDSPPKPKLIYKFPEQEATALEETMIPQLCFSDCSAVKSTTSYKSETFFFVIKDGNGDQIFGFCLRLQGSPRVNSKTAFLTLPTVVCLLTNRNAVGLYMKILLEIEKHLFLSKCDFEEYVTRLYNTEVPIPGRIFWLPDKSEPNQNSRTQVLRPTDKRIINTEVTLLLQFLEVELLLKVIASMLLERRILLVADSSCTLIKCVTAILSLLYPLEWRHSVIPSLPDSLLSQACSNSPYLFGISSHVFHKIVDIQKDKILIVDLDQGFALREVGDEHTILPSRSLKAVKVALSLAKNMTDPTEVLRDVMISEAFVRMFVETIGHCDKFIIDINRGNLVFQKDGFCKHPSSKSVQMFLTWFCETEMFEAFVDERIKLKETSSIRKQPVLSVPEGLFDRRLEEYLKHCQGSSGIKDNVRELGKKVKIFGERLKGLKTF